MPDRRPPHVFVIIDMARAPDEFTVLAVAPDRATATAYRDHSLRPGQDPEDYWLVEVPVLSPLAAAGAARRREFDRLIDEQKYGALIALRADRPTIKLLTCLRRLDAAANDHPWRGDEERIALIRQIIGDAKRANATNDW